VTIRYTAWDIESYYAKVVAAVAKANNDEPVGAFLNCNNFHGRLYEPLGSKITVDDELTTTTGSSSSSRVPTAASGRGRGGALHSVAKGGIDWFEAGRLHTGDILFTEDWFVSTLRHPPERALTRPLRQSTHQSSGADNVQTTFVSALRADA
jgi:hypothetical protein